jgi:nucleotide sugar dehydrogenase
VSDGYHITEAGEIVDSDVAIVGLGYVGMSLARAACGAGLRVAGLEISAVTVASLRAGRSHVDDVSDADVRVMLAAGFSPDTDPDVLATARTVVICVPTPLHGDGSPDLGPLRAASQALASRLRPGTLVVVESTSYPGTTESVVRPILEADSGLVGGRDFGLAFSPERIDPGNRRYGLAGTPKVVGGHTPGCTAAAAAFYRQFVDVVVQAKGTREAELAKIIENTYRNVNIALVNEFARLAHDLGIDVWDALNCAATKPFGYQVFYPGPGPGGHCIPIDPTYFTYQVRSHGRISRLVELALEINSAMPTYVVDRAVRLLNQQKKAANGSTVLLLGVTYKANISDQRGAACWEVARQLRALGGSVAYHDPYVSSWELDGTAVPRETELGYATRSADLTILLQDHSIYDPSDLAASARLLLDTCGRTRGLAGDTVEVL